MISMNRVHLCFYSCVVVAIRALLWLNEAWGVIIVRHVTIFMYCDCNGESKNWCV